MEKFSLNIQGEIDSIIENFKLWAHLFSIKIEYFIDGWALYLREKRLNPRLIVVFRSYEENSYAIRSCEIIFNDSLKREEEIELYKIEHIISKNQLIRELRDIIYGKDLLNYASNKYRKHFS